MEKINKKTISIVGVIVIILAISGIFYAKNNSSKVDANAPITATVRKATFSSVVNVTLSNAGKAQYKGATKYQMYYNEKAISPKMSIGKPTTAFPARKENDKVVVKLLKSNDKIAYSVDLKLKKGEALKQN